MTWKAVFENPMGHPSDAEQLTDAELIHSLEGGKRVRARGDWLDSSQRERLGDLVEMDQYRDANGVLWTNIYKSWDYQGRDLRTVFQSRRAR